MLRELLVALPGAQWGRRVHARSPACALSLVSPGTTFRVFAVQYESILVAGRALPPSFF